MKDREYEPKSPHILYATKDKHQPARTAESNQHGDSRNGVKARKKKIQTKWSMHKGPRHHLLVPSQYMGGGPMVKAFRGWGLVVGRKKRVYSKVHTVETLFCNSHLTSHGG